MKRALMMLVLLAAMTGSARRAHAWAFHDGPAAVQRVTQLTQFLIQTNQLIGTTRSYVNAFKRAYAGLKDWKHLGWVDTLQIVDMPWFDGVEGIDDIRRATYLTVMTADQAMKLWDNVDWLTSFRDNPRYRSDPWFRSKVDSLVRQSRRARATRAALLRQMSMQNQALIDDVKHIKRLRDAIEAENKQSPVNQAKVTSLQAELNAVEAKYQGQQIVLKNQQAIMFLVGEDDAQRVYLETRDRGWIERNNSRAIEFGRAFSR